MKWYYLFDRHNRWEILADSLNYCQQNKSLKIFGYVFMLNHLHLLIQSEDVSGFIRDFKRHTAKAMLNSVRQKEPRVVELFKISDGTYKLWRETNMPEYIETDDFFIKN